MSMSRYVYFDFKCGQKISSFVYRCYAEEGGGGYYEGMRYYYIAIMRALL